MKAIKSIVSTLVMALVVSSCGGETKSSVTGSGATFPLPFYNLAFKTYQESKGVAVTYGGIGSGGGIRSLKDKIVNFAGSDAYLSEKELGEMPGKVLHIPTCMGAVVVAYNLPAVQNLQLSGDLVADIFLGKITKWNDPRIAEQNAGATLPDMAITPTYRSDGSGTTFVFTDYLTKVSAEWADKMGVSKALKWPTGLAAKGNPGVAGTIKQTEGAIGYVGSEYAFAMKMPMAKLRNAAGNYVEASTASISAAATGEIPADMRAMITNSSAPEAYPISCFTWLLVYQDQATNAKTTPVDAKATVDLLKWMLGSEAQALTTKVHYAPLPASLVSKATKALDGVTHNGKAL